jgi:predicted Fe-Mo cluster-binding NifX family protein
MKIAIPTSDQVKVFERTGHAPFFAVATIEELNVTHIEFITNPPHKHTDGDHSHREIVDLLKDCDLLLVKKIGKHLRAALDSAGIEYRIIKSEMIGEALHQYISA